MESVIWKYELDFSADYKHLEMPVGARILDVQLQKRSDGQECAVLWAMVDPESKQHENRKIRRILTGSTFDAPPADLHHIATVQRGWFVVHFFEEKVAA